MTIADVPSEAGEVAGDDQDGLGGGDDLDVHPVGCKAPVVVEIGDAWQVHQELPPPRASEKLPPHQALVVVHHYAVMGKGRGGFQERGHVRTGSSAARGEVLWRGRR
jgi:hypothetical protein